MQATLAMQAGDTGYASGRNTVADAGCWMLDTGFDTAGPRAFVGSQKKVALVFLD